MMSSISSQFDVMREKHKKFDEDHVLGVLFPKCRKKHPLREFPLDKVKVSGLCKFKHDTKGFLSHPKSKEVFQASIIAGKVERSILIFFFSPLISRTLAHNFIAIFPTFWPLQSLLKTCWISLKIEVDFSWPLWGPKVQNELWYHTVMSPPIL